MNMSKNNGTERTNGGVSALFDNAERKVLFRKYLTFLCLIEVLIFIICWLYQLGNDGYDRFGPIEIPFPWKAYFMIAFLAPVAITFLVGLVIVGFNRYVADSAPAHPESTAGAPEAEALFTDKSGRAYKLYMFVNWMQKLPFLGLLLLLGLAVGVFYQLDVILSVIGNVGERSVKIILISAAVLVAIAVVFGFILIVLNYKLRKRSMDYQYRSEMAQRFGLIILDDHTVINKDGKLLVQGKKLKDAVPLLPATTVDTSTEASCEEPVGEASPGSITRPVDFSTSS